MDKRETDKTTSGLAVDSASTGYVRPKTRGELCDKLKEGIECEVVTSNVETTRMLIDSWLRMDGKYDVRPSENAGWSVFFPHNIEHGRDCAE